MKGIYIICFVVLSVLHATESWRPKFYNCPCPTPSPGYPECPENDIPQKPPVWVEIPNDCNHFILFDNYSIGHYESCPSSNPPLVFEINKGCIPKNQSIRTDCCPTGPTTLPPPVTNVTDTTPGSTSAPTEVTTPTSPETPSPTPTNSPTTTAAPETPSPTPTEGPTTTASPETPSPTPTEGPTTTASPETPSPTPTEAPTTTASPETPSPTPTETPTTTASPETPSPTPTQEPTTTASPDTPSPTPTEIPSSSPETPTTTESDVTTPNAQESPCGNVTATSKEVRIKNYPGCPKGPLDPTQFRIHLEIPNDCNHFIQCDNYGDGVCKVCAPSPLHPLVFDKLVNDQECSWPWDSTRKDCDIPS